MHTDSVTYVNANNRPSFFFFFIVQTLSFMHCTCNFICGLSDVIIKTFSQSVCRILYDHYLPTVILIIMGIPSPTHSFTLGLNPYFSANPPYRSLFFFFFGIHYMDFPDCSLLLLSISVSLLFSFFSVFTLF